MWCILFLLIISLFVLWSLIRGRGRERLEHAPLFTSIYYINLDTRPRKRQQIESNLSPLGKLAGRIIRASAVDGKTLSVIQPEIVSVRGNADLNRSDKQFGLSLTKGAVGCALSHKQIWEEVAETKKDLVLIVEDDAVILPAFAPNISKIIAELPDEWDILYLGSGQYTLEARVSAHLARPSRIYGLFGYAVNWRGAKRLLKYCFPLRYQLDTELWLNFKNLKPLVATPLVIGEKKGSSDVQSR